MPVDPSISLGVTGGSNGLATAGATPAYNPLGMVGAFADVQNKLNTNKTFQLQLQAKQKLGQIMSSSPDIPTAIQRAQVDPLVAPHIPELIQTLAGTENTIQQYRGQVHTQTSDAFTQAMDMLPGLMVEGGAPAAKAGIKARINNIPDPGIRATVKEGMDSIMTALDDPTLDGPGRMKAITGALTGIPGGLEAANKLWAQPGIIDQGNVKQPVTVQGSIPTIADREPGSVKSVGNALTLGLAPQITQTGGVAVGGKYGNGSGISSGGANAGGGSAAAPSGFSALEDRVAGDGKPLVPKGYVGLAPVIGRGTGTGGSNVMSPEQSVISQQLAKDFAGPGKAQFDAAAMTIGSLDEMGRNIDNMARAGGLLTPGSFGGARLAFGKTINTIAQAFGSEPPFDPSAVAAGEDIIKNTQRMGISTLTTMLGSQREAAQTIKDMTEKGVPGLDNSVMGFKVVASSIKAAAQRQMDLREFEKAWASDPRNQGNLTGAVEDFNKLKPAKQYIHKALDDLGMDESGFKSAQDVLDAVPKGYLTRKQALTILNADFPDGTRKK